VRRTPDIRGYLQYRSKTTPAEIERRRDEAYRLYREGYKRTDIAEALDISESVLHGDLAARAVAKNKRYKALVEGKPPRAYWRDEDVLVPEDTTAHYLNSLALMMIENSTDYMTRERIVNLFAHDVNDAVKAGDEAWISQARAKITRASLIFRRMHGVLDSPVVRDQAMRDAGLHPVETPATLRVVDSK
jgi:hypothetical protein